MLESYLFFLRYSMMIQGDGNVKANKENTSKSKWASGHDWWEKKVVGNEVVLFCYYLDLQKTFDW
jgi:hypothetical protein